MIVDWLSVVVPSLWDTNASSVVAQNMISRAIEKTLGKDVAGSCDFVPGGRRFPYPGTLRSDKGISFYYGANMTTILVEISGKGCSHIRNIDDSVMTKLLSEKITRIDIANDYSHGERPTTMVEKSGFSDRIQSTGRIESATGTTVYIGSQKSKVFARVYQYEHPHPRAGITRCELVFRHDRAQQIASHILSNGIIPAFSVGVSQLGMSHEVFGGDGSALPTTPSVRSSGKKLMWLSRQVIPAIKKMIQNEQITIEQLLGMIND